MFGEFANLDVIALDLHQMIEDSSSLHLTYKRIQISTTVNMSKFPGKIKAPPSYW